jgi:hypothetical protein
MKKYMENSELKHISQLTEKRTKELERFNNLINAGEPEEKIRDSFVSLLRLQSFLKFAKDRYQRDLELNKKFTEGDIEYEFTKLGKNTLLGIYYRGDGDPVEKIDSFIENKLLENYTVYVDMNMDNPWTRIIVIGNESKLLFTN